MDSQIFKRDRFSCKSKQQNKSLFSVFKKIITNLFAGVIILIVIYTLISSHIDAGGRIQNKSSKINNSLVFFSNNALFIKTSSNTSLTMLSLQGTVSSAARWLGYSKTYKGILFIDDMSDKIGVLQIDEKKLSAHVISEVFSRKFKGKWGINEDKLYNVRLANGAVYLESYSLKNSSKTDKEQSFKISFPTTVDNDLGVISKPSVCENLLVFSIAYSVYLIDLNTYKMKWIGHGTYPVLLNKDVVVYAKDLNDQNRLSVELYYINTKKYKNCDVWKAQGFARLPVLLPMVPHQRPDDIYRIEPINSKNLLLVEVTRHNYAESYLFMLDVLRNKSYRLSYSPGRSDWSLFVSK